MSHPRSAVRPGFVHALALALVTLAAGACSDNAAGPVAPSGDDAAISAQSFAALGSSAVLAAALSYPSAKAAQEEAPVSLTSSDGEGLALVSLDARAVVEGPLAFTELHLAFQNPTDRTIEGRFSITLPPGATVSRLAMSSPAGWQEAEVVERQLARRAYEDSLHRRVDPALLEKEAGNEFRARVFPIAPRAPKEIIVSYSQELRAGQRYKLNLKGLPEVGRIHATALVGGARREFDQKQGTPGRDFEVDVPASTTGLRSDDVVLARVRPDLGTERAPLGDVVVLFDTSASRALGFSAEVARLGRTLGELGKTADPGAKLTIAAFDQAVEPVFEGTFAELLPKHLDALLARRPLGATDLAGAAAWLGSRRKGAAAPARAIFVTDAVATASGADAAVAAVKALRPAVERVDVLLVGG
ncbi:MAG TPA: VIT and VWA domain-containing protein, partial [Byssovorax sp.]